MKRKWFSFGYFTALAMIAAVMGFGVAISVAGNDPPGGLPCSHGTTNKPCRPDPSTNGKDCLPHGNGNPGGVNEDHCKGTTTAPSTTATTVIPTTATVTNTTTQTEITTTTATVIATTTAPGATVTAPVVTPPAQTRAIPSAPSTVVQAITGPTKTVTISKPKIIYKTKIKTRIKIVKAKCVCAIGYRLWHGKCHPMAHGKG